MAGPAKKSGIYFRGWEENLHTTKLDTRPVMKAILTRAHSSDYYLQNVAGGFTMSPEDEKFFMTKGDMVIWLALPTAAQSCQKELSDELQIPVQKCDLERATAIF